MTLFLFVLCSLGSFTVRFIAGYVVLCIAPHTAASTTMESTAVGAAEARVHDGGSDLHDRFHLDRDSQRQRIGADGAASVVAALRSA